MIMKTGTHQLYGSERTRQNNLFWSVIGVPFRVVAHRNHVIVDIIVSCVGWGLDWVFLPQVASSDVH